MSREAFRTIKTPMGDKELVEKLGRNDPCPCGSTKRFKKCCLKSGRYDGANKQDYWR